MAIGNRTMFVHEQNDTATGNVPLTFQDSNVLEFVGAGSGAITVTLPVPKTNNSYGEVWIVNNRPSGAGTMHIKTDGTFESSDKVISRNSTVHCKLANQRILSDPAPKWAIVG